MCGIVGLARIKRTPGEVQRLVERMAERIHHRGPDGGGVIAHADATLGMKRLAIVDLEHGHQPMANEDESVVIVYNGEVYNAPELRTQLEQQGVRFRTRSDTEVILRLYERDPNRVEEHLVGMWAFAIHDRRRQRLVLSRDRFGIKPLFVAEAGGAIGWASELQCFDRALSPLSACFEIDHSAAHAMLSWSYIPETATIWKGVRRLPPASRLEIDLATGARNERVYWHLVPSPDAAQVRSLDDACALTEELLRRAVKQHLESDVPIATFLSGGIDSSLVSMYAQESSSRPIKAFTIGFAEKRFDESPYARATAKELGIDLEVETFDEELARRKVVDVLCAYDEPFGDSSSLATYLVSELIARKYKVALGGDGGDEVFAGYRKYLALWMRRPFAGIPRVRDALGSALGKIPTRMDRTRTWTEILRQVRRVSRGLSGDDASVYAQLTQFVPLARTASLLRTPASAEHFLEAARSRFRAARGTELQQTLTADLGNTLTNDMLVKVDRASMAHHLEARVPFLDHRVVEFGVGLPQRYSLGWNGKRVLRTIHQKRFGRALAQREKTGFGVPVERWLRGPFAGACTRLFEKHRLDRYGVLSSDALGNGRHREWLATDPLVVWYAFALASWCEINLGDGQSSLREIIEGSERSSSANGVASAIASGA